MKKHSAIKYGFFAAILIILISGRCLPAQQGRERGGGGRGRIATGQTKEIKLYDGSYALVIGNSEYSLGWERLGGVKGDVVAVRRVLERHGFTVEVEENLTSEQFERRIRTFINAYGYDLNNRLLIYYAGHGYTLKSAGDGRELGYVIPADTPLPSKDERGFRQKAVSMYAIQTFAKDIQAKHALFVFDSCFSGKLFALRNTLKASPFIVEQVERPVRQFITAGNETQSVPDESIFRKAFVRGLEGEADRNRDTYITGTELASYLKEMVTNYTNRRQTPQYGTLNDIDLDRGDFVFASVDSKHVSPTAAAWEDFRSLAKTLLKYNYVEPFSEGLAPVMLGLKWGYINEQGDEVIPAVYDGYVGRFREGRAQVRIDPGNNQKEGYIDKTGRVVIPIIYDLTVPFSEGLAFVSIYGRGDALIDKDGAEVIPFKAYREVKWLSEGLALVSTGSKYGFIDRNRNVVIPLKYDAAESFSEGVAAVRVGDRQTGKWGLIDRTGREVVPPKYDWMWRGASEGLVSVRAGDYQTGKWGFIDITGREVIPFKYDHVSQFSEGLAAVSLNGKWGFIDKAGRVMVPLKYDNVNMFWRGLAEVRVGDRETGKHGFIDRTGKVVVPLKYDHVWCTGYMDRGFIGVYLGEKRGFVDLHGNEYFDF